MSNLGKLFKDVVNEAHSFACEIHQLEPGALIPTSLDESIGMFWDNLCAQSPFPDSPPPPGLPPAPSPPFEGGQCQFFYYMRYSDFSGTVRDTALTGQRFLGAIASVFYREISGDPYFYVACKDARNAEFVSVGLYRFRPPTGSGSSPMTFISWLPVTPSGASQPPPDNCGNLPANYPPAAPPVDGFVSPPTEIVYNDNSRHIVSFSFFPPSVPSGRGKMPVLNIDVNFPNSKFPLTFKFDGSIDIGSLVPAIDIELPDVVLGEISNTNNLVVNIKNDLDFQLLPPDYDNSPEVDKKVFPPSSEDDRDEDSLLGVTVNLITLPDRAQFGTPTIYFAGWLSFKLQGGYVERRQINYESSYFEAPKGCKGYSYTITHGATAQVNAYTKNNSAEN